MKYICYAMYKKAKTLNIIENSNKNGLKLCGPFSDICTLVFNFYYIALSFLHVCETDNRVSSSGSKTTRPLNSKV